MITKEYPLILVCYLDSEIFRNEELIKSISDNFNLAISQKEVNAMAFFVPTTTEERIECINPIIASTEQLKKIDKLLDDLKSNFYIGDKLEDDYEGSSVNPFKSDES